MHTLLPYSHFAIHLNPGPSHQYLLNQWLGSSWLSVCSDVEQMVGIHKQQPNDHATHIEHTDCCPDSVDVE